MQAELPPPSGAASPRGPLTAGRAAAVAFLFAFVLLFLGTWTHALWDSDEPRFAEATREMFTRGDFLVPHLNATPRYDKPILVYWLQAVGYLLLGVGETGARLPSVLGLALASAFTARIGSRIFGPRAGLAAGLLLSTCIQGGVIGRAATADGILLGSVALTLDALHARLRGRRTASSWLQLYAGLALCFLAKGPPGWVAPLSAGAGAAWTSRGRPLRRRAAGVAAGLLLTLGLVAGWAWPALVRSHGEFWRSGLGHHVLERASRGFEGHGGYEPWWLLYYLPVLAVFLFPWSAWLPQAFGLWRRGLSRGSDRVFLGSWVAGTLAVFTLSVSKMPHYVLPLYPAVAVLLGGFFARREREGRSLFAGRAGLFSLGLLTVLGAGLGVGAPAALALAGFPLDWVPALSLTFLAAGWLGALWILRRRPAPRLQGGVTLLAMVGVFLLLLFWVIPQVDRARLVRKAGRALGRAAPAGAARYWVDYRPDGLLFYSQEGLEKTVPLERLPGGKRVVEVLSLDRPAAVILTLERERRILERQGLDRLPGRLAWMKRGFDARRARFVTIAIHLSAGT